MGILKRTGIQSLPRVGSLQIIVILLSFLLLLPACSNEEGGTKSGETTQVNQLPTAKGFSVTTGDGEVVLNWAPVNGATGYKIYKQDETSQGAEETIPVDGREHSVIDQNVVNGNTYQYMLSVENLYGEGGKSHAVRVTPEAAIPKPVKGITITAGEGEIVLNWTPFSQGHSYNLYRAESPNLSRADKLLFENINSPYQDLQVANGTTYYYVVTVLNQHGESIDSEEVSATPISTTPAPPTIPDEPTVPNAPTRVSVTIYEESLSLSWEPVEGVEIYNLYWQNSSPVTKETGTIVTNATSPYFHQNLSSGQTYYYAVTTMKGGLESELSAEVSATPIPLKPKIWVQEAYIKAANADVKDFFGRCVSLSGDTLAVGAYMEDSSINYIINTLGASPDNTLTDSGAVYVYQRTGTTWVPQAYIKAANADSADWFGYSVSVNGDSLAVGAINESSNQNWITNGTIASTDNSLEWAGTVYIYQRTNNIWVQQAYIKSVNIDGLDLFGRSVSLEGNTLAVGAVREKSNQNWITNGTSASTDDSLNWSGAVYVYQRVNNTWAQQAYIKAVNNGTSRSFGGSVSLNGDSLAVGAITENSSQNWITNGDIASMDQSTSHNAGAVYIYQRTGSSWKQQAYIKAVNMNYNDLFGYSISLYGDTLAVGAVGESSRQNWITNGNTASEDNSFLRAGAVYIYQRTGSTWEQQAYIKALNGKAGDYFGYSVSLQENRVVVGVPFEGSYQNYISNSNSETGINGMNASGAVYVYHRIGNIWEQQAYIKASNSGQYDRLGESVSLNGDSIAVGALRESSSQNYITNGTTASIDNSLTDSGAVYIYRLQ